MRHYLHMPNTQLHFPRTGDFLLSYYSQSVELLLLRFSVVVSCVSHDVGLLRLHFSYFSPLFLTVKLHRSGGSSGIARVRGRLRTNVGLFFLCFLVPKQKCLL